jgi:DNA gyrase subunit B
VRCLNRSKTAIHGAIFWFRGDRDGITASNLGSMERSYQETMHCYTNSIPQRDIGRIWRVSRRADPHDE